MNSVNEKVKHMVDEQLRLAGFDQDLSAGDLTMRSSVVNRSLAPAAMQSYASVLTAVSGEPMVSGNDKTAPPTVGRQDRREEKIWLARRSLRLWPLESFDREGLTKFLKSKMLLDDDLLDEIGQVEVKRVRDPRNKQKDEAVVIFENKTARDSVKAKAANLANFREEAGMRLEIPDHLQKDFHSLMNLGLRHEKEKPRHKT